MAGPHDQAIKWAQDAILAIKAEKASEAVSLIEKIIAHERSQGKEGEMHKMAMINEEPNKIKTTAADNEAKARSKPKTPSKAKTPKNVFQQLELFAKGNPDALRRWYEDGADGLINWGEEGDLTRCHEKAMEYMDSEQAWGFCERRAEAVYGESNRSHDIKAGQYPKASASAETESLESDIEAFCSIDGCSKESHSSGKCITHYQQMRRERKDTTAENAKGKYKN